MSSRDLARRLARIGATIKPPRIVLVLVADNATAEEMARVEAEVAAALAAGDIPVRLSAAELAI